MIRSPEYYWPQIHPNVMNKNTIKKATFKAIAEVGSSSLMGSSKIDHAKSVRKTKNLY